MKKKTMKREIDRLRERVERLEHEVAQNAFRYYPPVFQYPAAPLPTPPPDPNPHIIWGGLQYDTAGLWPDLQS